MNTVVIFNNLKVKTISLVGAFANIENANFYDSFWRFWGNNSIETLVIMVMFVIRQQADMMIHNIKYEFTKQLVDFMKPIVQNEFQ